LYFVKAEPLIGDQQYDEWERELKELVTARPHLECAAAYSLIGPTRTVGTSHAEDYPRTIQQLAESLLAYAKQKGSNETVALPARKNQSGARGKGEERREPSSGIGKRSDEYG
jgi:hypothetical protein